MKSTKSKRSTIKKHKKHTSEKRATGKQRSKNPQTRIENIIMGAIGPYKKNCAAFGNPSGPRTPNYINVCKLDIGVIKLDKTTKQWDEITKGILAYDRAETNGAYLGQLNIVAASSFIGPHGALWGYELADNTRSERPMYSIKGVPIYDIKPLLQAGEALLGSNQDSTRYYMQTRDDSNIGTRFAILPGEIQPCAVKSAKHKGGGVIWCAIGIGFPIERLMDKVAKLFYEDAGFFSSPNNPSKKFISDCEKKLEKKMKNIVEAMIENGIDQIDPITYDKIFIGFKMSPVMKDEFGTAITLSPYMTLAQNAVPNNPRKLAHMTLEEWEKDNKYITTS